MDISALFKRSVWDDTDNLAVLLDINGTIVDLNQPMADQLGQPLSKLKGANAWKHSGPGALPLCQEAFERVVKNRKAERFEERFNDKWSEWVVRPCYGDDDEVIGVSILNRDTTSIHRAYEAPGKSERRLRFTLEGTDVGLWEFDFVSGNAWRSHEHARIFGYLDSSKPWHHADFLRHVIDSDRPTVERTIEEGRRAKKGWTFECRIRRVNGEERWIWVKCGLTLDELGQPMRANGVTTDITDRKLAQLAGRESELRFAAVANSAPVLIWMSGLDKLCDFFNKPWLDFTGRTIEQERGNGWAEGFHPDDMARCLEIYVGSFDARRPFEMEYRLRRQDGEYRWVLDHGVPRYAADGSFLGYIGSCIDITDQKRDRDSLARVGIELRTILDTVPAGVSLIKDRKIVWSNAAHDQLLGYQPGETVGLEMGSIYAFAADYASVGQEGYAALSRGEAYAGEFLVRRKDGSTFYCSILGRALNPDQARAGSIWTIIDITERKAADQRLKESQHSFATMFRSSPVPAILSHVDTELFVDVNDAFLSLFGFTRVEVIGHSSAELGLWPIGEQRQLLFERLRKENIVSGFEAAYRTKNGQTGTALFSSAFINLNGQRHIFGMLIDYTERKHMEDQLRLQAEMLDHMEEGVILVRTADARIVYTNRKYEALLGYAGGELIGQHVSTVNDPIAGEPSKVAEDILAQLKETSSWEGEVANRRKNGTTIWNRAIISKFNHSSFGEVWLSVMNDITERKRLEGILYEKEQRLRAIYETSADPIGMFDSQGNIVLMNPAAVVTFGYGAVEEMVGKNALDFVLPEDRDRMAGIVRRVLETGLQRNVEFPLLKKDGTVFMAEFSSAALYSADGAPSGIVAVTRDISKRKRIELELRASEERLRKSEQTKRTILESMLEGIVFQGAEGTILECNPSAERILGLSQDQILGRTSVDPRWRAIREDGSEFPGQDHPAMLTLETGKPSRDIVMGLNLPDGSKRWININSEPLFRSAETRPYAVITSFSDITSRKQMEVALRNSEEKHRMLFERASDAIMVVSEEHHILAVNTEACRQLGFTRAELQGMTIPQIVPQEVAAQLPTVVQNIQSQGRLIHETLLRRKDGSLMPVENHSHLMEWDNQSACLVVCRDLTERKRTEERLRQSQKMEAIGHLAGGMAHEFNNILAGMMLNLSLARMVSQVADRQQILNDLEESCQRSAGLIKQLLAFSRQSIMERLPFNLGELVANQARLFKPLLGERIRLELQISDNLPLVKADKILIEQVLLNLCLNARDAMKANGLLRLQVGLERVEQERVKSYADARPGEFLRLSVSDTGRGMDDRVKKRLFEPFFTTKDVGEGTGLGLATVRGIVQQHQGWIEVDSELGIGSVFRVYLPASELAATTICAPLPPPAKAASGIGTILIAEDDAKLREISVALLRRHGYRVLEAPDGASALVLWAAHRHEIDLLYTDMVMPGEWSGLQLAERCRTEKPALKILITSGYNTDILDIEKAAAAAITYLPKPCPPDILLGVINRCLQP